MSVAIQNEPVASGKLVVPPADAAQWVQLQIEKGHAIRKVKLRYAEDLEKAREKKGEWVKQTNDLLKGMFDTETISNEFNTWEVRVLPEYAELSLFIDVFYEEMDQRLMRLNSVYRRIPGAGGSNGANGANGASSAAIPAAVPAAPKPVARPAARAPVAASPDAGVSSASPSSDQHGKCLLIIHGEPTPAVERVADFVSRLDFDPIRVESTPGDNAAAIEGLEQHPNSAFAVIVLDAQTAASARPGSGGMIDSRLVFQLGYCVGKLGLRRICVLIPDSGGSFCDQHGVLFVPLDGADGWQLQVARQLKRSGIDIDLNRMC